MAAMMTSAFLRVSVLRSIMIEDLNMDVVQGKKDFYEFSGAALEIEGSANDYIGHVEN